MQTDRWAGIGLVHRWPDGSKRHAVSSVEMNGKLKLRQFDQKFHESFVNSLSEVLNLTSPTSLPSIFMLPVAVALASDMLSQLQRKYQLDENSEQAKKVEELMHRYMRTVQYHYAMMNGESKYNLDFSTAGPINEPERNLWTKRFSHLKNQQRLGNRKAQMNTFQKNFSRT